MSTDGKKTWCVCCETWRPWSEVKGRKCTDRKACDARVRAAEQFDTEEPRQVAGVRDNGWRWGRNEG